MIELHSFAHHADLDAFDATMRRQAELAAGGYPVVPISPRELRTDPAAVRRKLRAALREARALPTPTR